MCLKPDRTVFVEVVGQSISIVSVLYVLQVVLVSYCILNFEISTERDVGSLSICTSRSSL